MEHDPLSDVLRSVRLRGAVFYYVNCRDAWVADAPASRELAQAVMPGAEHVMAYHLVAKGSGWATLSGQPPVHLVEGDLVMFARGDAHQLSSAPGLAWPAHDHEWLSRTRHDPKPIPVAYHRGAVEPGAVMPLDGASAVLVCGFIACDLRPFNPLIAALPPMLHMSTKGLGAWVGPVLHQAVAESRERRAGSAAVLERVSEMLFVDAARRYLEALPEDASGWLAALRDRYVGRALGLLHAQPAKAWTLDALGQAVGLSRSALHERFAALVGQAPMQYLTQWRMQRGAALLREGHATVAAIAQEVGYESEAAFARAFKRAVGLPPAAWRRAQAAPT